MTLIKELIEIPEQVQRGDFVLNLSQGLEGSAVHQTLAQYVVTPQLATSFEDALGFIKSAVVGGQTPQGNQNRQKGAYLHGSFGSGKSHFMAVLHLLLQGNTEARAMPELAPAVSKHDEWLHKHNILLVPYHMIGAPSIEAGILGGYVRYIQKRHPDAPQPGFYLSDRLFRDAVGMRERLGDAKFFEVLNQAGGNVADNDGWGELAGGWDAISFDAVVSGLAGGEERARLVGADLTTGQIQHEGISWQTDGVEHVVELVFVAICAQAGQAIVVPLIGVTGMLGFGNEVVSRAGSRHPFEIDRHIGANPRVSFPKQLVRMRPVCRQVRGFRRCRIQRNTSFGQPGTPLLPHLFIKIRRFRLQGYRNHASQPFCLQI